MVQQKHPHEKNPLTAHAALETIAIIEDENLVDNAAQVGGYALERLHDMKTRYPLIGNVTGLGLCIGLDLVTDGQEKTPAPDAVVPMDLKPVMH